MPVFEVFSFFAANSFSMNFFFLGRGCCFDLVWQSGGRVIWTILSTARLRGGTVRCAGRPWPPDCVRWRLVGEVEVVLFKGWKEDVEDVECNIEARKHRGGKQGQ